MLSELKSEVLGLTLVKLDPSIQFTVLIQLSVIFFSPSIRIRTLLLILCLVASLEGLIAGNHSDPEAHLHL